MSQQTFESMNALVAEGDRLRAIEREAAEAAVNPSADSRQRTMSHDFSRGESMREIKEQRKESLKDALSRSGYRPKHTVWKVAMLAFNVTKGMGVLRWSVQRIRKDKFVGGDRKTKCRSRRSVIDARKALSDASLIDIVPCPSVDGGDPIKGIQINWANVFKIASGENLHRALHRAEEGAKQGAEEGANLDAPIKVQYHHPPPPSPTLSDPQLAAVEILKTVLSDEETIKELATDHADRVATVVSEYELNREHLGPGAVSYRLKSPIDAWPTDKATKTLESEQRRSDYRAAQQRHAAEREAKEADQKRKDDAISALRLRHGPLIDAMSDREFVEFGLKWIPAEEHVAFRRFPRVFEPEILEAMEVSCPIERVTIRKAELVGFGVQS